MVCENNRCGKTVRTTATDNADKRERDGGKNATRFKKEKRKKSEAEKRVEHVDTNLHAFQAFSSQETNSGVVGLSLPYDEERRTTKRTDTLGEGGGRWR